MTELIPPVKFQGDIYHLWVCEWRRNRMTVLAWARNDLAGKSGNTEPVCFVEHQINVTEFHECNQAQCTEIPVMDVELIRLADYDDYEKYLICDVDEVNVQKSGTWKEKQELKRIA